ncbi:ABC transporter substrate-binding protein [Alkalicella caledoniensis]|uniref:ABC transporter substrate-binding protein n=1 Tax=Alkalicella caledoniensis TaxID=2731377 RepID=A0A7G9W4D4_ALKCA|nr:ABC transporter substrate-binding protein [Alkalicella caledoniensis]QNO13546.1 ABC transporter substrate-binding protein [Alkalicella caledoniensis]
MKKFSGIILVFMIALSIVGCSTNQPKDEVSEVKIVSIAPSNTEIVAALGGLDNLVGVTDFCNYPAEVLDIEKVGDSWNPNYEKIVALAPDYVLLMSYGEPYDRLVDMGLEVIVIDPQSIDEIYTSIEDIAALIGKEDKAQQVISEMKSDLSALEAEFAEEKPTVFMLIDSGSFWTGGNNTFANEVIRRSGGINAAAIEDGWYEISQEKLLELNPQYILYSWPPDEEITSLPAWQNLTAVKEGRVIQIDGDLTSRPSNRIVEGIQSIFNIIQKGE